MNYFPSDEQDVFYAIDKSFSCYGLVMQKILPSAFLLTLIEGIATYGNRLVANTALSWFCMAIEVFIFLFFTGALLYQANALLEGRHMSHKAACQAMLTRIAPVYAAFAAFTLFVIGYYELFKYLIQFAMGMHVVTIIASLFALALLMVSIVFFLYTVPSIIIDGLSPLKALARSYVLSKSRPVPVFIAYAAMAVVAVAVSPHTRHAYYLMQHHSWLLLNFAVYALSLPFVVNYMLFVFHDLKVRYQHRDEL